MLERRAGLLAALAIGAVVAVMWARVVVGGQSFAAPYYQTHVVPEQAFAAEARAAGRLPLWWDEVALGVPFAAVLDRAALYPPAWLATPLPRPWALDALVVAHLFGFGLGAALLARRLGIDAMGGALAGALAACSGLACSAALLGPTVFTLAWTPWVLVAACQVAAADRRQALIRPAVGLAAALTMMVLGGDLDLTMGAALVAVAVAAARSGRPARAALVALGAVAVAAAAAAVALVPAVVAGVLGPRSGFAAVSPLHALELLVPEALGQVDAPAWDLGRALGREAAAPGSPHARLISLHLGVPVLLAAAFAARAGFGRLALGAAALAGAALAATLAPAAAAGMIGGLIAPATLLACVLAGAGGSALARGELGRIGVRVFAVVALGWLAVAVVSRIAAPELGARLASLPLRPALDPGATIRPASAALVAAAITAVLVALWIVAASPRWRALAGALAAALLAGYPASQAARIVPLVSRDFAARPPGIVGAHPGEGRRFYRPLVIAGAPAGDRADEAAWAMRSLAGASATSHGYAPIRAADPGEDPSWRRLWRAAGTAGERLFDLVAVERAMLPATVARSLGLEAIGRDGEWVTVALPPRRTRAFVATAARHYTDEEALYADLFPVAAEQRRRAPTGEVRLIDRGEGVVGEPGPGPGSGDVVAIPCAVSSSRPERVELDCDSARGGHAVLLDSLAPGWAAAVDGVKVPIARADLVARAVALPPGRHHVIFEYTSPGFAVGAAISLLAWLGLAVLWWLGRGAGLSAAA